MFYYLELGNVSDFGSLWELVISDIYFFKLCIKRHLLLLISNRASTSWNRKILAREWQIFLVCKGTFNENHSNAREKVAKNNNKNSSNFLKNIPLPSNPSFETIKKKKQFACISAKKIIIQDFSPDDIQSKK